MPSTQPQAAPKPWNRNVDFDAAKDALVVSITGPNPPPPDPPTGHTRNDSADEINVFKVDRGPKGAKIRYHAPGNDVKLTGIAMKVGTQYNGGHIGVEVNPAGTLMTLTVTKDSDKPSSPGTAVIDDYDYYVQGTVDGTVKQTEDPRIRNRPE